MNNLKLWNCMKNFDWFDFVSSLPQKEKKTPNSPEVGRSSGPPFGRPLLLWSCDWSWRLPPARSSPSPGHSNSCQAFLFTSTWVQLSGEQKQAALNCNYCHVHVLYFKRMLDLRQDFAQSLLYRTRCTCMCTNHLPIIFLYGTGTIDGRHASTGTGTYIVKLFFSFVWYWYLEVDYRRAGNVFFMLSKKFLTKKNTHSFYKNKQKNFYSASRSLSAIFWLFTYTEGFFHQLTIDKKNRTRILSNLARST